MRAVVANELGPPENYVIEEQPSRAPKPGEVRVRVHAAGVSYFDCLIAAGGYQMKPPVPFIPGSEFAGEIVETGEGVSTLQPGDRVCGGNLGGVLAEEITLSADNVQKIPDGVAIEEAAVVRASYLTAWYSLVLRANLAAGEDLLVLGGAGAVGIASCQIGKHLGARVIAAASTPEKRAFALEHGASHAVNIYDEDWREQIRAITGKRGVDVVLDVVGGDATERAFRSLAWKGRHLIVGYASGTIPKLPVNLALLKGAALLGVDARQFAIYEPEAARGARDAVMALFEQGAIRPPIARTYRFEDFAEAMKDATQGKALGRIVVQMISA